MTRAKPGMDTTTVQRGLSGATGTETECAVPGTFMVGEAKVTGPGTPNATSVVTETVVQSTAVAEIAVEAEARSTEHHAAAVAETAAEAGARRAEQHASAVVETEARAEARQSKAGATSMLKMVDDAEANPPAPHTTAAAKAALDAVAPAQAEAGGGVEANHTAQHAAAGTKTMSDAVAPAQGEAETDASYATQLERAVAKKLEALKPDTQTYLGARNEGGIQTGSAQMTPREMAFAEETQNQPSW